MHGRPLTQTLRHRLLCNAVSLLNLRSVSDFAYVRPGIAVKRTHVIVWDEMERVEKWQSASVPYISSDPRHSPAVDTAASSHARLLTLRATHPDGVWLVAFCMEKLETAAGGAALPLTAEDRVTLLSPASAVERTELSTEAGRAAASKAAREASGDVVKALGVLEAEALDGGLGGATLGEVGRLGLTFQSRAAATHALAARRGVLFQALAALRRVGLFHAARIDALGGGEESALAETEWLRALNLAPGATPIPHRAPRVPDALWAVWDDPLVSPMSAAEAADEGLAVAADQVRSMGLEHRDRVEFLSRARLPLPLSTGAPTADLSAAAKALDMNPSLKQEDKELMLSLYADAVARKPNAYNFTAERVAYVDPQPQWGFYDPTKTKAQDDASDALRGRGRFSAYRGSTWETDHIPPRSIGLAPTPHEVAGTPDVPLETHEEILVSIKEAERRAGADSARAVATITASLEAAMGLRPRGGATSNGGSGGAAAAVPKRTFFERLAAGERPRKPEPPLGGHRYDVPRLELVAVDGKKKKKEPVKVVAKKK